jgi:ribosomal protein S18 acetylase RimI-like enzyme
MRESPWRRAVEEDLPALELFLRVHEAEAVGFASRLIDFGSSLEHGRLRLPRSLRSSLWVYSSPEGPRIVRGAVLCTSTGLAFPFFPEEGFESDPDLAALIAARRFEPASIVGPAREVERLESALSQLPLVAVDYRLMRRFIPNSPPPPCAGPLSPPDASFSGLSIRAVDPSDLEALFPLQEAYEREEVLTPIHRFDASGSRAALARSLREETIVAASLDGRFVGKAGTNARAFAFDQIGGVFVAPPYRRRGIGKILMEHLLARLSSRNKGAVLFVKSRNAPALALYRGLGFEEIGDYRADYLGL